MTTLSLILSLVSLSLAAAMAGVLVRMRRDEARRSAARVAALSGMAAADFLSETDPTEGFAEATSPLPAPATPLFTAPPAVSEWGRRLAIAGVIVAALAVVGSVAAFRGAEREGPSPAAGSAPLELLELSHQQTGAMLSVAGRVRNPRGAAPLASPTATVFLFGADGAFLTSGRALLDLPRLAAGAESAFAVSIPVNGVVARYRVSFRDSANHPVAHLDLRSGAPLARNQ